LNYAPETAHNTNLLYRIPHNSLRQNSTRLQKIKRKYYNIFNNLTQEHFYHT